MLPYKRTLQMLLIKGLGMDGEMLSGLAMGLV